MPLLRIGGLLLAVGAAAEVAVLLLWPRSDVLDPVDAPAGAYFTAEQIARAQDFRGPQLLLVLVIGAIHLVVLALVARRAHRRGAPADRGSLRAVALVAAGLSVLLVVAALPVSAVARQRAIDVGLVTSSWGRWASDVALSAAVGAAQAVLFAVLLVALIRRFPRRWWLPGSALVAATASALVSLTPLVVDPLFNDFAPLRGPARAQVLELADRAGVDADEVYVMDAGKRTTAANAYVAGIGGSKRIVLYDTLRDNFPPRQQRSVIAHELAHAKERDLPRGLLFVLLVAPAGLFAVAAITRRLAPAGSSGRDAGAATVPAIMLALALVVPVVTTVSGQLSREVEARADTIALQLTDDPQALVAFQRALTLRNLSDPDPPAWRQWWRSTHPSPMHRIGIGLAWEQGRRP